MFFLNDHSSFPPLEAAGPDGLLAIGGDLNTNRLLNAYTQGIFPWYDEPPILWWSPDPRMVLFPAEIVVSRSMQKIIRQQIFQFTMNQAFDQVIRACKTIHRPGQQGTWITDELEAAFNELHALGYAKSAEVWRDNQLVGGVYGLLVGKVFFAESMFSLTSNASKFGLVQLVEHLFKKDIALIDCQVYSDHLATLGARLIDRNKYLEIVKENT